MNSTEFRDLTVTAGAAAGALEAAAILLRAFGMTNTADNFNATARDLLASVSRAITSAHAPVERIPVGEVSAVPFREYTRAARA